MFYSLQSHELEHARLPCPSLSLGVCSNSCPLNWWQYLTISSSAPLSPLPSNFPSIRIFSNKLVLCIRLPRYWSFSFSINPSNECSGMIFFRFDWLHLLTVQGSIRVFCSTTIWKHQFFGAQPSFWSYSHPYTTGKTIAWTIWTFVSKVISLFNILSTF